MSEIVNLKHGKLIGIKTSVFTIFNQEKYDPRAIPGAWQEFFAKASGTNLTNTKIFYGASMPSMSMNTPMDYFAGAIVDENTQVPDGFESVEIPEGNYLCHIHVGPITDIAGSYEKTYMETLPSSGKEMRPAPHLEIYNSELNPMDEKYEMTIAVPIL